MTAPTSRHDADETTSLLRPGFNDAASAVVDEEAADFDLAKVQSIVSIGGTEPFPDLIPGDSPYASTEAKPDAHPHFINVTHAEFWGVFSGILFSWLLANFDSTLMASIHPAVTSHFHAANSASWLSTVFLLTSTAFQPVFGRISDVFGRRPVYLFAVVTFFITTAWCATAQSIGSFIAARAICGLGAGGVISVGMIISSDLVRVEYRGTYQSYLNLAYGTGSSLGVACGGYIADTLGWRAAFGIQLPFIFLYMVLAYFTVPSTLGPELARNEGWTLKQGINTLDLKGSFLLVSGVTTLLLAMNLGGNVLPWHHPLVISSLVMFFLCVVPFLMVEAKATRPVMPLELLSKFPQANLIISNFFGNMVINTVLFNVPLFFQAVKLESLTTSGLRILTSCLALTVTSVSTGFFITWSRRLKPTIILGNVCFVIAGIVTGCLTRSTPGWLAMLALIPSSFGQGFAFPTTLVSTLAISPQAEQAVTTTTLGLFRSLGSVFGIAVSSWTLQNSLLFYLKQTVTGDDKADIIRRVRESITEISHLDPVHRDQVIGAYEQALRLTFIIGVLWAWVSLFIVLPVKLPRLGRKP
ncbi:multidrug resistance protein fnx1 [Arthroderma uncinatum]|uniref:multidrug resistance protein fnx1 n=1 Tax=Arthroderma uncinatum TaxID=74035 RepID=UPI00144AEBE6|nr:multidrug resistance protein fnx1 [Arthroderma uncinatum]KAF3483091.1 multidrug resistance protein fnx1 [Arthroderma uncinatum]